MATRAVSIPARTLGTRAGPIDRFLPLVALPAALALVASLAVALGRLPGREPSVASRPTRPAPLAPAPLRELPDLAPAPSSTWPRSAEPLGGLLFVRCTNLWGANADGSNARRLLTVPGLASPTVAPDGRSIAYLGTAPDGRQQVWLAAADGSATRLLGALGEPGAWIPRASGLTWSPDGAELAFALRPPVGGRGEAPWSLWTLRLASGRIERVGAGGATPVWLRGQLLAPADDGVVALWGRRWASERLSKAGEVAAMGLAPGWWARWDEDTALVVREGEKLVLAWRPDHWKKTKVTAAPPPGYQIDPTTPVAVAEGALVAVPLLHEDGGPAVGLFDPLAKHWRVLGYAWDPAFGPAPAAVGSLERAWAVRLTRTLLWSLGRERVDLLLARPGDLPALPFDRPGHVLGTPRPAGEGWVVPATVYGRTASGFAARDLDVRVRPVDGRLVAAPRATGPLVRIRTVDDAVALLDRLLTAEVVAPAGLPEGTRLAPRAFDAWSWDGSSEGALYLAVPGFGRVTFHYGSAGFGCGPSPVPLTLATGTGAITTDPAGSGGWNTIAWPARPRETSAPFGISGAVPTSTLVAWASAIDRAGLA
jgi:hypothetical protein